MISLTPDAVLDVERVRHFLEERNPEAGKRALAAIWRALEQVQAFPEIGAPTGDADIRQIVVRFGASGYIVRYTHLPNTGDILITRLWHGREARG
jgi:plasmid stabilization system protein ParE